MNLTGKNISIKLQTKVKAINNVFMPLSLAYLFINRWLVEIYS